MGAPPQDNDCTATRPRHTDVACGYHASTMRSTTMAPVICWKWALLLATIPAAAGCRIHERYLVDRSTLLALSSLPEQEREALVVPAVRERDQVKARVRA